MASALFFLDLKGKVGSPLAPLERVARRSAQS